jgi:hypothetical protein
MVTEIVMGMWHELVAIAESLSIQEEEDQIIWSYESSGIYTVQSLYAVISF